MKSLKKYLKGFFAVAVLFMSFAVFAYERGYLTPDSKVMTGNHNCDEDFDYDDDYESSDDTSTTSYADEKVMECFNLTNAFRLGDEAYFWNEDNRTGTYLIGKLGKLKLDPDLCKAAQIRANEITKSFSHTRLNGSSCFTVLSDVGVRYSSCAENIAAGSSTGKDTFLQWKEDNEKYIGQGHRRNMLTQLCDRIGIAYVYVPKSTYKYYWVMILAKLK